MRLKDEFENRIVNWQEELHKDEWFFVTLRKELTSGLKPHEAFLAIPDAVHLTIQQTNKYLCYECFMLLLSLARVVDTTEMPPYLDKNWDLLCDHVLQIDKNFEKTVHELHRWYRRYPTNG